MALKNDEEESWKMYLDGASNSLRHGIRAILNFLGGKYYLFITRLNFDCTNNMEEYEACILGLHKAIEQNIKVLRVYGDSILIIYQLCDKWETRDSKLILY